MCCARAVAAAATAPKVLRLYLQARQCRWEGCRKGRRRSLLGAGKEVKGQQTSDLTWQAGCDDV